MGTNMGQVMTLANSIIGVSVLAMPYCFKQCGVVLSILLLLLSSILSRIACNFLLKAAIITRRRNYEFLAFHVFGSSGKLVVELCIIGFLLGTCVAFFVVMGDLGPAILSSLLGLQRTDTLRTTILIVMALLVVLPLGLLRNVDSLSSLCAASIAFYLCLVLKVMGEATSPLVSGDWLNQVHLWRPDGVLQCLPIFSMALFCQTQLFEIFDTVPNAALDRMNAVVRLAINMCTAVYICVGFFGYVAFCNENISGNILVSLSETVSSEVIKLGFVLSVAVSFPLVIFPCRGSLYSLLYRSAQPPMHDIGATHVPENRFKLLTIGIVSISLALGLLLPNIEHVLGLVGSTIGITVCITFPAVLSGNTARHPRDKLVSQVIFFIGIVIMFLGTYAHLLNTESHAEVDLVESVADRAVKHHENHLNEHAVVAAVVRSVKNGEDFVKHLTEPPLQKSVDNKLESAESQIQALSAGKGAHNRLEPVETGEKRHEPPIPVEPMNKVASMKPINAVVPAPEIDGVKNLKKKQSVNKVDVAAENEVREKESILQGDQVHQDAIRHEDKELALEGKKDRPSAMDIINESNKEADEQKKKAEEENLVKILEQHKEEQRNLLHEQQKILLELKKHEQQQQADKQAANEISKQEEPKSLSQKDKTVREVNKPDIPNELDKISIPRLPEVPKYNSDAKTLEESRAESQLRPAQRQSLQMKSVNQSIEPAGVFNNAPAGASNNAPAAASNNAPAVASNNAPAVASNNAPAGASNNAPDVAMASDARPNPKFEMREAENILRKEASPKPIAAMPIPLMYRSKVSSIPPSKDIESVAVGRDILESNQELKREDREKRDLAAVENVIEDQGAGEGPVEKVLSDHSEKKSIPAEIGEPHLQVSNQKAVVHSQLSMAGVVRGQKEDEQCDKAQKEKAKNDETNQEIIKDVNTQSNNKTQTYAPLLKSNENNVKKLSDPKVPLMELKTPSSISEPQLDMHLKIDGGAQGQPMIALPTKRDLKSVNKEGH